jgi:hypothetical protein
VVIWLFILNLICTFDHTHAGPNSLIPHPIHYTEGFSEFRYNQDLLLEMGNLKTAEEMQEWLERSQGINVIVVPKTEDSLGSVTDLARWYFQVAKRFDPELQKMVQPYAAAYIPPYEVMVDSSNGLIEPGDRPHSAKPTIIVRENAFNRVVFLHEFFHHLISRADTDRLRASSDTAFDLAQSESSRNGIKQLENFRNLAPSRILEFANEYIDNQKKKLREEFAVNLSLLNLAKDLHLTLRARQGLYNLLLKDFDLHLGGVLKALAEDLKNFPRETNPTEHGIFTKNVEGVVELKRELVKLTNAVLRKEPQYKILLQLNAKGIFLRELNPHERDPWEVIGLGGYQTKDPEVLELVQKFWMGRTHPSVAGGDAEAFRLVGSAIERIHRLSNPWTLRDAFAPRRFELGDQASFQALAKFAAKFGAACAVGAAYCSLDQKLPWNGLYMDLEFGGSWMAAALGSTILHEAKPRGQVPALHPHPIRTGVRQGAVIGVGLALCWELLKKL